MQGFEPVTFYLSDPDHLATDSAENLEIQIERGVDIIFDLSLQKIFVLKFLFLRLH